jgi:glycosyltransferase involved in cell wall biosynthesis
MAQAERRSVSDRVLVVAPQPFFTPRGTPFSVYYRTLVMAEVGLPIDLLTYGQGEDVEIDGVRIIRIPDFPRLGPVKIGPSLLKLWLDIVLVLWTVGYLVRRRYAIVHAHEEAVFFLRFLKPIFRFRLIYDMHSSLPEQLKNYQFTTSRLLIGLFEKLEASCLAAADAVITICPELQRYAKPLMPDPSRHFLIENSIFEPVRLKRRQAGQAEVSNGPDLPAGRRIVLYAGTFEVYQGLDTLLAAFAKAHPACPEALLVLVGGTPAQVERIAAQAAALGIGEHVLVLGRMPKVGATRYLQAASVLVSPRSHGTNTPLKIYEQLASGVPLVATRILSHTQVLDESVAFLVDPAPEPMADGLLRALTDETARAAVVANAKALYERAYSRPVYVGKMRALLERVGASEPVHKHQVASHGKS